MQERGDKIALLCYSVPDSSLIYISKSQHQANRLCSRLITQVSIVARELHYISLVLHIFFKWYN